MKKAIALFVFFLGATYLSFSQEKNNLDNLTSGKWQVKVMEINGEKLELSGDKHWMVFQTNGTYKIALAEKEQLGTWQLLENQKEIKFDSDNFYGSSKISKLTDKEFLFSISEGDVVYNMVLQR